MSRGALVTLPLLPPLLDCGKGRCAECRSVKCAFRVGLVLRPIRGAGPGLSPCRLSTGTLTSLRSSGLLIANENHVIVSPRSHFIELSPVANVVPCLRSLCPWMWTSLLSMQRDAMRCDAPNRLGSTAEAAEQRRGGWLGLRQEPSAVLNLVNARMWTSPGARAPRAEDELWWRLC